MGRRFWWVVGIAAIAVLGLWAAWGFWLVPKVASYWAAQDLAKLGQVGDLFGGINALFAAMAFAGVAVAAYLQFQSYKLLQDQHRRDSFEPLFFKLLERLDAPSTLVLDASMNAWRFEAAVQELRARIGSSSDYLQGVANRNLEQVQAAVSHYEEIYARNQTVLGPYFRSLYHVFKLIDTSQLEVAAKVQYANIARSTLHIEQLFLLELNCACDIGKGFKPLVERYGLLKHIMRGDDVAESVDQQIARLLYAPTAVLSFEDRLTVAHAVGIPGAALMSQS